VPLPRSSSRTHGPDRNRKNNKRLDGLLLLFFSVCVLSLSGDRKSLLISSVPFVTAYNIHRVYPYNSCAFYYISITYLRISPYCNKRIPPTDGKLTAGLFILFSGFMGEEDSIRLRVTEGKQRDHDGQADSLQKERETSLCQRAASCSLPAQLLFT
jgi:hypothetical protein